MSNVIYSLPLFALIIYNIEEALCLPKFLFKASKIVSNYN
jgi:hypothetical protein